MTGVIATLAAIAALFFLFYRIVRAGAKSDKRLRELSQKALG